MADTKDTESRVLLQVPDIMRETGFARTRVFELFRSGELPSRKVGRLRVVQRDAFDAWCRRVAGLDEEEVRDGGTS